MSLYPCGTPNTGAKIGSITNNYRGVLCMGGSSGANLETIGHARAVAPANVSGGPRQRASAGRGRIPINEVSSVNAVFFASKYWPPHERMGFFRGAQQCHFGGPLPNTCDIAYGRKWQSGGPYFRRDDLEPQRHWNCRTSASESAPLQSCQILSVTHQIQNRTPIEVRLFLSRDGLATFCLKPFYTSKETTVKRPRSAAPGGGRKLTD